MLQHALQGSYTNSTTFLLILDYAVAITITTPLIVYSRESEQHISDRKIPVHVF